VHVVKLAALHTFRRTALLSRYTMSQNGKLTQPSVRDFIKHVEKFDGETGMPCWYEKNKFLAIGSNGLKLPCNFHKSNAWIERITSKIFSVQCMILSNSEIEIRSAHLVARVQHFARGDILNEKMSLNIFRDKSETERRNNYENLLTVYLCRN
jgi:hypothetical protein